MRARGDSARRVGFFDGSLRFTQAWLASRCRSVGSFLIALPALASIRFTGRFPGGSDVDPPGLRVMRAADLLASSRQPGPVTGQPHEGTIVTDRPNVMWFSGHAAPSV
jgi:hypothetical protein